MHWQMKIICYNILTTLNRVGGKPVRSKITLTKINLTKGDNTVTIHRQILIGCTFRCQYCQNNWNIYWNWCLPIFLTKLYCWPLKLIVLQANWTTFSKSWDCTKCIQLTIHLRLWNIEIRFISLHKTTIIAH